MVSTQVTLCSFNSTKVQLTLRQFEVADICRFLFQFHYGTINTRALAFRNQSSRSFNSTKVQLTHVAKMRLIRRLAVLGR